MAVKITLLILETVMLIMFLIAFPVFNIGNITGIAASCILILITARFADTRKMFSRVWGSVGGKIAVIAAAVLIAAIIAFACFCTVNMLNAMEKSNDDAEAVIVLGCQVRGDRPSKMLKRRLDAAIVYLNDHPGLPCIVSGGKGADEDISEALCMKNYLVEQGIPGSRIIMEDKSTTTDENLQFSFRVMDEMGLKRKIVLVTDGFHQYRAQLKAERHGAETIGAVSTSTEFRFVPTYWVREWAAIAQELFLT